MPCKSKAGRGSTSSEDNIFCGKEVRPLVIIGNGPSAIALSYMLAGNVPYYKGQTEDPYLHKRLMANENEAISLQNLQQLATGCEGRSNNPVSVFFDMLNHPEADLGLQKDSLLEWRQRPDLRVDHVILGKGKPGGCWEAMEGNVQTVSLGNWMELPDLKMSDVRNDNGDARVLVSDVANYYQEYVRLKGLGSYFVNNFCVTTVREIKELSCPSTDTHEQNALFQNEYLYEEDSDVCGCSTSEDSALSMTTLSSSPTESTSASSSPSSSSISNESDEGPVMLQRTLSETPLGRSIQKKYSNSNRDACNSFFDECSARDGGVEDYTTVCSSWNPIVNPELFCSRRMSTVRQVPLESMPSKLNKCSVSTCFPDTERLFEVSGVAKEVLTDGETVFKPMTYLTKEIVLATGSYDSPNTLNIPGEDLDFVLHNLKDLEKAISNGELNNQSDPILIIGAGLSAADGIVTAKNEGISVVHAFRKSVTDPSLVFRMLPKALYPEYHHVYSLMKNELKSELYVPLAEHQVVTIDQDRTIHLHCRDEKKSMRVSKLVILIGSSPDLDFLEPKLRSSLGIIKDHPISRNNPIDIDLFSNEVIDEPGVYAMGPLVGDNFVRFLQGGALAISSKIIRQQQMMAKRDSI